MAEEAAISVAQMPLRQPRMPFVGTIIRFVLSGVFLAAALWLAPGLPTWDDLSALNPAGVAAGAVLCFSMIALLAWRWRRIAAASAPRRMPELSSFIGFTWACLAVNQIVPSVVGGDALRITLLARTGVRTAMAAASVITDRLYGLVGLVLVCVVTAPFLGPALYLSMAQGWALVGVALLAGTLVVWLGLKSRYVSDELRAIVKNSLALHDAPILLAATVVGHLLNVAIFLAIAHALGVEVPLLVTTAVLSAVFLAGVLPISIAGWGVREFALVNVLGQLGAEHDKILLVSLVYGFFLLVFQALGFFMILRSGR